MRAAEEALGLNHTSKAGVSEDRLRDAKQLIVELTKGSAYSKAEIDKLADV